VAEAIIQQSFFDADLEMNQEHGLAGILIKPGE
jgi:hypothetical protein